MVSTKAPGVSLRKRELPGSLCYREINELASRQLKRN